jgi:hypothetical protein
MRHAWAVVGVVGSLWALAAAGCGFHYVTPGEPANFRALGIAGADAANDPSIAAALGRRPAAGFPAVIAAIRVQGREYHSRTSYGYGSGSATVVTTRDIEKQEDFDRLAKMPLVRAVVPINRLVVPDRVQSEDDLRQAAAAVHADLTLLYTFDTKFSTETTIPALGVLTLGLFPNRQARVISTASAVLLDTGSGYIYALAEATDKQDQIANAWTSEDAVDQSRRRAERRAFESLLTELEGGWKGVVDSYIAPSLSAAPARVIPAPVAQWPVAPRVSIPARAPAYDPWAPPGVRYRTPH